MAKDQRITREQFLQGDNKRKAILSLCYQLPSEMGLVGWDDVKQRQVVNMAKLNAFLCGPKSIYKKKLNYHTPEELSKVIVQFENMLKGYMKK